MPGKTKQGQKPTASMANSSVDRTNLPLPEPTFKGVIGKAYVDSTEDWPAVHPPEGAPNVVVILLDDVGFGQVSTFGGPVPTPELDKLAARGLCRFHTTAICRTVARGPDHRAQSPQLRCRVSRRMATGFPSYNNMIRKSTATIGAVLKGNGYNTSWFGKNHNTPDWESSVAGPFDRWATGMGFDNFYGFIGGETNQYYPVLFENTVAVESDRWLGQATVLINFFGIKILTDPVLFPRIGIRLPGLTLGPNLIASALTIRDLPKIDIVFRDAGRLVALRWRRITRGSGLLGDADQSLRVDGGRDQGRKIHFVEEIRDGAQEP
jgi:Sulfatase